MRIIVFAERFERGAWTEWEHVCSEEEIAAVEDSARTMAIDRRSTNGVFYIDYLMCAEGLFNAFLGGPRTPAEGDTKVFGVAVGEMVFARYEKLKQHFELRVIA